MQPSIEGTYGKVILMPVSHDLAPPGQEAWDPAKQPVDLNDCPFTTPADATGVEVRIEPGAVVSYEPG